MVRNSYYNERHSAAEIAEREEAREIGRYAVHSYVDSVRGGETTLTPDEARQQARYFAQYFGAVPPGKTTVES